MAMPDREPVQEQQNILQLSTVEFFDILQNTDLTGEGNLGRGLHLWQNVDFHPEEYLRYLATPQSRYRAVQQSDGISSDEHNDGLYYEKVPSFAMLYCREPGVADIRTAFVDTRPILQQMEKEGLLKFLRMINMIYMGKDDKEYPHSFVETHSLTGEPVAIIGGRAYPKQKHEFRERISMIGMAKIIAYFSSLADNATIEHVWQKGDVVVWGNQELIHRRVNKDEVPDTQRELIRIWQDLKVEAA